MNSPSTARMIMTARYRRHNRGPRGAGTGLFEELDPSIVQVVTSNVDFLNDELPVVASVVSDRNWLVVSTSRIVASQEGQIVSLRNTDISDVTWDADACARENQVDTYQLAYLLIKTFSGAQWSVHIEPGGGYLGILSVIKMISDQNWRAQTA